MHISIIIHDGWPTEIRWYLNGDTWAGLVWPGDPLSKYNDPIVPKPTSAEVETHRPIYAVKVALLLFQEKRKLLLGETSEYAAPDMTMSQGMIDYRAVLRALPGSETPALDSQDQLTGITWPAKPQELT